MKQSKMIMKRHKKALIVLAVVLCMLFLNANTLHAVSALAADKMTLSDKKVSMYVGETFDLSVSGSTSDVSWASSNTKVVKVSNKGQITAIAAGKAKITAICDGVSISCKVTVLEPSLSKTELTLVIGETYKLKVSGGKAKTYETSRKKVAKVSSGGKITAKAVGTAVITVVLESGKELQCDVKVVKNNELSAKEVYQACIDSVVEIDSGTAIGSGFYISKTNVVTNYHVIEEATKIAIKTYDGETHKVLKVLGYSEKLDLAILEVDCERKALPINTHGLSVGETSYAIGSSLGLTNTFSNGIITNDIREIDGVLFIQTNAAISHGNSGGPLINAYGEVVGITTAYYTEGQNLNLAINISELDKVKTDSPQTVKSFIKRDSSKKTDEESTKKAQPDIEAKLYYGDDYDFTRVCIVDIKNNGKKKVTVGGAAGSNLAIVYPYDGADYSIAFLTDASTLQTIQSQTINSGKSEMCVFVLEESRLFTSSATIGFTFKYDGVEYFVLADAFGNAFWKEND